MDVPVSDESRKLIRDYGDQAYWKAVSFSVLALKFGDLKGQAIFAQSAQELMNLGFHKHEDTNAKRPTITIVGSVSGQ